MIAELQLTEEQLRENGYPRPGDKPGMAHMFKPQSGVAHNKNDRYCSRCGTMFNLEHFEEFCVDKCNYHAKRPGFRRGNQNISIDNKLRLNASISTSTNSPIRFEIKSIYLIHLSSSRYSTLILFHSLLKSKNSKVSRQTFKIQLGSKQSLMPLAQFLIFPFVNCAHI